MKRSLTGIQVSTAKYSSDVNLEIVPKFANHFVIIPVAEVNMSAINAIRYAKLLDASTVAVHILFSSSDRNEIEYQWKHLDIDIPLIVLDSPAGAVIGTLKEFVNGILKRNKNRIVTVVLPVITGLKWWQQFLHNQTAKLIEKEFQNTEGVVTIRVPFSIAGA